MAPSLDLRILAADLEPDGSLRDIYIMGTTLADWEQVYQHLLNRYSCVFCIDNAKAPAPPRASDVFELGRSASTVLTCSAGPVRLNCHFFNGSKIELDFWPEDISDQGGLDALFALVEELGALTGKTVLVTPENSSELPFLRWDPQTHQLRYVPPPFAV